MVIAEHLRADGPVQRYSQSLDLMIQVETHLMCSRGHDFQCAYGKALMQEVTDPERSRHPDGVPMADDFYELAEVATASADQRARAVVKVLTDEFVASCAPGREVPHIKTSFKGKQVNIPVEDRPRAPYLSLQCVSAGSTFRMPADVKERYCMNESGDVFPIAIKSRDGLGSGLPHEALWVAGKCLGQGKKALPYA